MTIEAAKTPLRIWLSTVCVFIVVLILFGGFVRLSRSGLSMVEWHVVTGVVPPIGEAAWREAFARYRRTPEFRAVNPSMTLHGYKSIYRVEYAHRMLGRVAGLIVFIPLVIFLVRGAIPLRASIPYLGIGLLFALQGFFGWYMVQSGLIDRPSVSPYRLAGHLLIALTLLTLCLRLVLKQRVASPPSIPRSAWTGLRILSSGFLGVVTLQIAYGALMAGLKAGYVSDTFPFMFGAFFPPGMFSAEHPWFVNLVMTGKTVHFVHRWFAFAVLGTAVFLYHALRKSDTPHIIRKDMRLIILLIGLQILMGIGVILFHVPVSLALVHQAIGVLIFVAALFLHYRLPRAT